MIRRALALLALLPVIGAAAPMVAVVGDSVDADRLFAEMAASGEVDLLERERIRDLLAEQKLAELNARDLRRRFPHVEYYVVVGKAQVLVFDAKAGVRIADFIRAPEMGDAWLSLPPKAILNRARSAQESRPTIQVSVIAVLDRGVPERFRPQMRRFQSRFDAALIEDGRFLFLERRETGHITAERDFSDTAFPLIPSEHLLRVAYTPGERASVVHCTVRVQDRKGKQTAKVAAEEGYINSNDVKRLIAFRDDPSDESWINGKGDK